MLQIVTHAFDVNLLTVEELRAAAGLAVSDASQDDKLAALGARVSSMITAACYVPLGRMMDVWGRAEGFLFMTICATVGLIMMAACNNLATFCAAYVRLLEIVQAVITRR